MECDLPPELNSGFSKLCSELQLFLNRTESCLHLAKENFKQVEYIWKPWNVPKNFHLNKCSCSTLKTTQTTESSEHVELLNNVSKTLKEAETIRKMSSKCNRKSDTALPLRKTVSNQTTSSSKHTTHLPSCPLYNSSPELSKKGSSISLSDALSYYKMPSSLKRVHKYSYKIINAEKLEQKTKIDYKSIFIHKVESKNEILYASYKEDPTVSMLFTCLSALHSYEKKRKYSNNNNINSWIFYRDWNYLKKYVFSQNDIAIRESWTSTKPARLFQFREMRAEFGMKI